MKGEASIALEGLMSTLREVNGAFPPFIPAPSAFAAAAKVILGSSHPINGARAHHVVTRRKEHKGKK